MGEHQPEMVRTVRAPDGWAWEDVYVSAIKSFGVGGWLSGIAMQRGEPILEAHGHTLIVRQGETSFEPRNRTVYEKLSMMELKREGSDEMIPAVEVLVVLGFQGERSGYVSFRDGVEVTVLDPGPVPIREYIVDWFRRCQARPIIKRVIHREEKPDQLGFEGPE